MNHSTHSNLGESHTEKHSLDTTAHHEKDRKQGMSGELKLVFYSFLAAFLAVGGAAAYAFFVWNSEDSGPLILESTFSGSAPATATVSPTATATAKATATPTSNAPLPANVLLDVPFQLQAPFSVWDEVHKETCEEASLMMVYHFYTKKPIESKEAADKELLGMVDYETKNGYKVDVTVGELAKIAEGYYGLKGARLSTQVSAEAIKRELAAGRPVIIPAAGRMLPNPYFRQPGPPYHMLVVKGYDRDGFITNDPGIGKGNGFRYAEDALIAAIHDWNGSVDTILQGEKVYLVFDR